MQQGPVPQNTGKQGGDKSAPARATMTWQVSDSPGFSSAPGQQHCSVSSALASNICTLLSSPAAGPSIAQSCAQNPDDLSVAAAQNAKCCCPPTAAPTATMQSRPLPVAMPTTPAVCCVQTSKQLPCHPSTKGNVSFCLHAYDWRKVFNHYLPRVLTVQS